METKIFVFHEAIFCQEEGGDEYYPPFFIVVLCECLGRV